MKTEPALVSDFLSESVRSNKARRPRVGCFDTRAKELEDGEKYGARGSTLNLASRVAKRSRLEFMSAEEGADPIGRSF